MTDRPETGQHRPVKPPLDLTRIAKALEDAGMEPGEARSAATRLRARSRPKPPSYLLDSTSRKLRDELLEAIAETKTHIDDAEDRVLERIEAANRRHVDNIRHHLDAVEHRIAKHLARLACKLLAAHAAILAIAIAALRYLG